jgi:hypothetical protein
MTVKSNSSELYERESSISLLWIIELTSIRQPPHRRHHLSTVDFALLDCLRPADVSELQYSEDGFPKRRSELFLFGWSERAACTKDYATGTVIPGLLGSMDAYTGQTSRTRDMAAKASASELLAEAKQMLVLSRKVSTAAKDVLKIIDEAEVAQEEITTYIRTLQEIVGSQSGEV